TSVAVQDLERVRAALGYERINLYGTSYGTRVAQHYLRRFPERVRAVILDGVVPAPLALGPDVALDAERSLLDILARCAARPPRAPTTPRSPRSSSSSSAPMPEPSRPACTTAWCARRTCPSIA